VGCLRAYWEGAGKNRINRAGGLIPAGGAGKAYLKKGVGIAVSVLLR
jgi:hypothetical protein